MSSARPLRDAMLAVRHLTVIPLPTQWPEGGAKPDVAGWFPLVGVLVGTAGWGVVSLTRTVDAPALLAALSVAVMVALTGGLHWDGLADVTDAWQVHDPERRQQVLKDSAVGAFGALAIALTVGIQVTAIAVLADKGAGAVLPVAAAAGRLSASFSAWLGRPARPNGLGAAVSRRPGFSAGIGLLVGTSAIVGIVRGGGIYTLGAPSLAGAIVLAASALVVPHVVSGRFNGTNGDTMGAGIVLVETLGLVLGAVVVLL